MKLRFIDNFLEKAEIIGGYNDLELRRIRYTTELILSELSKLLIFCIIFYTLGLFKEYFVSLIVFICLRSNMGGLHFRHYFSCFFLSFLLLFMSILLGIFIPFSYFCTVFLFIICTILTYIFGPISADNRPLPLKRIWKKARIRSCLLILFFGIISLIQKPSFYADICIWTIIFQTVQLITAYFFKKGVLYQYEK